jgi:hypothetical protein
LNNGFGWHGPRTRAALLIKEIQDLAKRVRIRGIPEKRAFAAHVNKTNLLQFFQMVRKRGSRDTELLLDFARNHSIRVGRQEQAKDLQTGLRAESRKTVGGARHEQGIGLAHSSIIAEI